MCYHHPYVSKQRGGEIEEKERAIIASVKLRTEDPIQHAFSMDELKKLAQTLDYRIIDEIIQVKNIPDPHFYLGKGKLDQIKERHQNDPVDCLILDGMLSPSQNRNVERYLKMKVLDRTEIILKIFAEHAKTRTAKTQVEIAQLQFLLTRLHRRWDHLERQRGGVNLRGVGEKQIELDRRLIKERIAKLNKDLVSIDQAAKTKRNKRREFHKVALVGYTNAGKSSLLRRLTGRETLVMDKLFATLDSSVKSMKYPEKPQILITDTVGFIKKLPHSLIASFKSTLDEVGDADLLLHVLDIGHSGVADQQRAVEQVLGEIECLSKPTVFVCNKADTLVDRNIANLLDRTLDDYLFTSTVTGEGIDALKNRIYTFFDNDFLECHLVIGYGDLSLLEEIRSQSRVLSIDYGNDNVQIRFTARNEAIERLKKYLERKADLFVRPDRSSLPSSYL